MPALFSSAGLTIQTLAEALAEQQTEWRTRISARIATAADSFAGSIQGILALREYYLQEILQRGHQARDPRLASGAHLDIALSGLGVDREPAVRAEVLATVTSTGDISIPDGTRVSVGGFTFATIGGPYARTGAGTIEGVRVRSELYQPIDVSTLGAWTITDTITDWTEIDDTSQPIAGSEIELDGAYRARAEIERYKRASGPLPALDAGVGSALNVSYARAYENVDASTDPDADGIPYGAINVVADGGLDADVAAAIEQYGPAATAYHGATSVTIGTGTRARVVSFDRVEDVDLHIRATFTTSTSDDASDALDQAALELAAEAALLEYTTAQWGIGVDVIPAKLAGALSTSGIPAIDDLVVEVSLDGSSWQTTKQAITIRQRAIYSAARVTVPTPS